MSALPLPSFRSVKMVVTNNDDAALVVSRVSFSSEPDEYDVIRIVNKTGKATCIGRELDLKLARIVARRPKSEDGKPVK